MNPVDKAKHEVCARVGANIYGRTNEFLARAEQGDDAGARRELLELLKFFPKPSTNKDH
jgi:hypothetical protein